MRIIKRTAIPFLAMALAAAAHMDQASLTLTPAGQPAYLALYGTGGLGSCQDGLQSTAPGQVPGGYVEVTPELVSALRLDSLPEG